MRVVDKHSLDSLNDAEKFWVKAGEMSVMAMLTDRSLSDFFIEDRPEVIAVATEQYDAESGVAIKEIRDKLFQAGVVIKLKQMLKADAQRLLKEPDSESIACGALLKYLTHLVKTDPKFTISARAVQPRKAVRKLVEHDENGRIKSFLEVEESVVI
jgi:hypothetical protein